MRRLRRAIAALLGLALVPAVAWAAGPGSSVAVVWLGGAGKADQAFEADLLNVLLERLAEADLSATVITPQHAMVRRAMADEEIGLADATSPADATSLVRLGRGLGVDWVVGLRLEALNVADDPAKADVAVTALLVDSVTGGQAPLRVEKRAGEAAGIAGVVAPEATVSRILASAMAYRVCEAVVGGVGEVPKPAPTAGPSVPGPRPVTGTGPAPLSRPPARDPSLLSGPESAPVGVQDETVRLEQLIAAQGASAELCLRLGDAYLVEGQWERARKEFQKAATLAPTLPDPHVRLGDMASDGGLWQDAIKEYKVALELDPANITARLAMARALEQANQRTTAAKELEVAAELDPDNGSLWVKLGDLRVRLEQLKEAEQAYLAALQAKRSDPQAYGRLGQLCAQRGRFKDALTYYVRAAKAGGEASPKQLEERQYRMTMAAADEALAEAMRASRDALQGFHDGQRTREDVYQAFTGFAEQSGDISRFAEALEPPRGLESTHALRLLAYALVQEADLTILQYIDTNDTTHLDYARQLRDEAVEELEKLLKGNPPSR